MNHSQKSLKSISRIRWHRECFCSQNANSALKLGHARAAAICASFESDINVFEYSPREVKLSTVGTGKAEKEQVMEMVKLILSIKQSTLKLDESDALAVGICHAHYPLKTR